ncbi:putative transglutaminase-like cysteine proteinase [Aquamicrobium lusatiense]|uniref:Putative transglutaminase-like cysteine proteinase n=1 Tax=Aquamicrobium lusatiense TaxID=89772 RepID=A0A7W9VWC1_9HYPH|nr:putative transglutaminase-like cysteine proteinase [Aquamicrobium lusatiense]
MTSFPSGLRLRAIMTGMTGLAAVLALGVPAVMAGSMVTSGITSQPIGHYDFCQINKAECSIRTVDRGPVKMTQQLWDMLVKVSVGVNAAVTPMSDMEIYGKEEVWAYPDNGVGDCEDYVLEKRRQLNKMGVPLSDLLITVVRKPDGEGHAVLTVRTSKGDFILDNLRDDVRSWEDTGYRYLKRQASNHTGRWVSIRDDQQVLVGSVR